MTIEDLSKVPAVAEFKRTSSEVLTDLSMVSGISTLDALSNYEVRLTKGIQALERASAKLSRAVYTIITDQRAKIDQVNRNMATDRVREVLGK